MTYLSTRFPSLIHSFSHVFSLFLIYSISILSTPFPPIPLFLYLFFLFSFLFNFFHPFLPFTIPSSPSTHLIASCQLLFPVFYSLQSFHTCSHGFLFQPPSLHLLFSSSSQYLLFFISFPSLNLAALFHLLSPISSLDIPALLLFLFSYIICCTPSS